MINIKKNKFPPESLVFASYSLDIAKPNLSHYFYAVEGDVGSLEAHQQSAFLAVKELGQVKNIDTDSMTIQSLDNTWRGKTNIDDFRLALFETIVNRTNEVLAESRQIWGAASSIVVSNDQTFYTWGADILSDISPSKGLDEMVESMGLEYASEAYFYDYLGSEIITISIPESSSIFVCIATELKKDAKDRMEGFSGKISRG